MVENLKTLKEIDCADADHPLLCGEDGCTCYKSDLRAEAVKICNILSQRKGKLVFGEIKLWWDCRDLANNDAMIRKNLLKDFIMWQNNLTEEDLA